ncbi:MAG: hypothetical protein AAFO95_08480 [Cyanobacteria bacterium J06600_6]
MVYAAGGNWGRELNFQIDQSGEMANQMNYVVNSPSKPVVLMLGSHDSTIYNIQWTKDTDIVAVVVSGIHRQAVAGLPDETPILNTTLNNSAKCGHFYMTHGQYEILDPLSNKLFGQSVEEIYFSNWISKSIEDDDLKLYSSDDTTVDSFYDPNAPLAGQAGVEAALKKGVIRKATESDLQAWIELQQKLYPEQDVTRPEIGYEYPDGYVVIDEFTYPNGLSGGIATFLIPKDVPEPNGNSDYFTVYNFKTGICSGVFCTGKCAGSFCDD